MNTAPSDFISPEKEAELKAWIAQSQERLKEIPLTELPCLPYEPTGEEKALRDWLMMNKAVLAKHEDNQIIQFALANFDQSVVFKMMANVQDAMRGIFLEDRAKFKVWCFDEAVQEYLMITRARDPNTPFCNKNWKELVNYQITGEAA